MYVIVEYFNYRKNVTINIIGCSVSEDVAKEVAYNRAFEMYGDDVTEVYSHNMNIYVELEGDVIVQYSEKDGYDKLIYAVVKVLSFDKQ